MAVELKNKAEAQAFLDSVCKGESDGLPNIHADESGVVAALQLVGQMANLGPFMAKLKQGSKAEGKAIGRKTESPMTPAQLAAFAASGSTVSVAITVDGKLIGTLDGDARQFSSGGYGYNCNGKLRHTIDGVPVTLQSSINLSIVGSKLAGQ